ncbi:TerB family tellurite resistance protein [Nostoc sp.]|uniref:TerB family tellurite resistance protein n=1 Tax=Nostoc sp. TaxID=1180 RepID=UPI002FF8B299
MSSDVREMISKWAYKHFRDFDTVPPDNEILKYAKALLICANGDGTLTPEERNWVLGYFAIKGVSDSILSELKNYQPTESLQEVLDTNSTVAQKGTRFLIYDAIQTCAADGEYAEGEKAVIRKAASQLKVSEDVVKELEELYLEEKELFKRKIDLMFPNGKPH